MYFDVIIGKVGKISDKNFNNEISKNNCIKGIIEKKRERDQEKRI